MNTYAIRTLIPLHDQQQEWEYRMRMVHEAQRFLYASTYFLQHDRYGREYMSALLAARKRGVSVTILIDGFGQILAGNLMTAEEKESFKHASALLTEHGGNVVFYRCRPLLQRMLGSGMHIKIQISEKGGALFSSGNISATSYDKWREFSAYVEGPITVRLLEEFTALGVNVDADHLRALRESTSASRGAETIDYLSYNPTPDPHPFNPVRLKYPNTITDYLAHAIANAQQSICLTSLYFKPAPSLIKALTNAAKRGVSVEIFHSHYRALGVSIMPWIPSFYLYRTLMSAGIAVYENIRGEHSKIVLIDGKSIVFGSYNFEYAAHDRLAEAIMVSRDARMLASAENMFNGLRKSSDNIPVNESTLSTPPKNSLFRRLFFRPFLRWI
jgi:cardiolipin synthase